MSSKERDDSDDRYSSDTTGPCATSERAVSMLESPGDLWIADWATGCFRRREAVATGESGSKTAILVAGDWAPGSEQQEALLNNPQKFYGEITSAFSSADLSVVNLEAPVHTQGMPLVKDGPSHALQTEVVTAGLRSIGCSIACLANNHIMDYGDSGLSATLNALHGLGIETIGAGRDRREASQPYVAQLCDQRIAFLNVAEGEESKATAERPGAALLDIPWICYQIRELIELSNAVIVIVHAGREFTPVPPPYIRETYRALADAGASIVVGHHPHVPQGIELWNGVPIIYSLGNFVLREAHNILYQNRGYLLNIEASTHGITAFEVVPYEIHDSGLHLLTGEHRTSFLSELEDISKYLTSPFLEEVWLAYADLWWDSRFSKELMSFATLLSWQDWGLAAGHRIAVEAGETASLQKLIRRVTTRIFRWLAGRLPPEHKVEPQVAAVFRNRFDTPAHSELYKIALDRAVAGSIGQSASWARELLERWQALS